MSFWNHPRVLFSLGGRQWPTFQLCGLAGLLAGSALACLMALRTGLDPVVVLLLAAVALAAFLALVYASSRWQGGERLAFYPAETAALVLAAPILLLLGQPVLPYLDLLAIGLAGCYAFIRLGCHYAGCCHGKVSRRGVRYGSEHVAEGFAVAYAELPLFPVQALESLVVAVLTASASGFVLSGKLPAGNALCFWLGTYAVARFFFDLQRADPKTPYEFGMAKAQWSALGRSLFATALAAWLGSPLLPWLAAGAGLLAGIALVWQRRAVFAAFEPQDLHQIAKVLALAEAGTATLRPRKLRAARSNNTCRLLFSCARLDEGEITQITLSHTTGQLPPDIVAAMAATVRALRPQLAAPRLLASGSGIVHLLFEKTES